MSLCLLVPQPGRHLKVGGCLGFFPIGHVARCPVVVQVGVIGVYLEGLCIVL